MENALITVVSIPLCLLTADFFTGLLHWFEDTWLAPGKSRLLDKYVVLDNIEHHRKPGSIRGGTYWRTNYLTIILAGCVAACCAFAHVTAWQMYFTLLILAHSNHVHMWGHSSKVPPIVAQLQRLGILQSTRHRAVHHKSPYATRFCTMTNYLNPVLDRIRFWRGLEWLIESCGPRVQRATAARSGY